MLRVDWATALHALLQNYLLSSSVYFSGIARVHWLYGSIHGGIYTLLLDLPLQLEILFQIIRILGRFPHRIPGHFWLQLLLSY